MVTINPFAWKESIHRMFYFPQNVLWCVKAYMYSETEIKKWSAFCAQVMCTLYRWAVRLTDTNRWPLFLPFKQILKIVL